MKKLLALFILWPSLTLAQFAPAILPGASPNPFGQHRNTLGIPNGYPYFGSASGLGGYSNSNVGYPNSGFGLGGNYGFNSPDFGNQYAGHNPYAGYNQFGGQGQFNGYNPYGGYNSYNSYGYNPYSQSNNNNGGFLGGLLNMLPGMFGGFNTNIGGMDLSLGFNTGGSNYGNGYNPYSMNNGGCIGCMNGSMFNGGPSPINFQPQPMFAMNDFGTEAGFMNRPAAMPMVPTGGDRIATTAPAIVPMMERRTRDGVGPRAPAILPASTDAQEIEARNSDIWNPFINALKACAADCQPAQYHAFGERTNASCHSSSDALDVGSFICSDGTHQSINKGRFETIVVCMRRHMERVLYFNGSDVLLGHQNHAHFSNGCIRNGEKMW